MGGDNKFVSKANIKSIWAEQIKPKIDNKLDIPENDGTTGQVLVKSEEGASKWENIATKIQWRTYVDDIIQQNKAKIQIGENTFILSDKSTTQYDADGNNVLEQFISKLPTKLTFTNGKALTGFEDNNFKNCSFINDTLLNGALVITKDGLHIHDGSEYENFTGVVLSVPGYSDVTLDGELEVKAPNSILYSKLNEIELNIGTDTPEQRAVKTILENYDGLYIISNSLYFSIITNFRSICEIVEKQTGQKIEIDYKDAVLALPSLYKEVDYGEGGIYDILIESIPYVPIDELTILYNFADALQNDNPNFTKVHICDFTYSDYTSLFEDVLGKYYVQTQGGILYALLYSCNLLSSQNTLSNVTEYVIPGQYIQLQIPIENNELNNHILSQFVVNPDVLIVGDTSSVEDRLGSFMFEQEACIWWKELNIDDKYLDKFVSLDEVVNRTDILDNDLLLVVLRNESTDYTQNMLFIGQKNYFEQMINSPEMNDGGKVSIYIVSKYVENLNKAIYGDNWVESTGIEEVGESVYIIKSSDLLDAFVAVNFN